MSSPLPKDKLNSSTSPCARRWCLSKLWNFKYDIDSELNTKVPARTFTTLGTPEYMVIVSLMFVRSKHANLFISTTRRQKWFWGKGTTTPSTTGVLECACAFQAKNLDTDSVLKHSLCWCKHTTASIAHCMSFRYELIIGHAPFGGNGHGDTGDKTGMSRWRKSITWWACFALPFASN